METSDREPAQIPTGTIAVIPTRMGSTRFPGKPLANQTGKPMVQHVYERASEARSIDRVIVATDDQRIVDAVQQFGGEVVMTSPEHPNGTSRIAEVASSLESSIIVNVQGDEPLIEPEAIDLVVSALERDPEVPMATVACPFADAEDPADENLVKVFLDEHDRALDFSRSQTPQNRLGALQTDQRPLRHLGLYAYRPAFLQLFTTLTPTPLEQAERLEQLRALEHGHPIAVAHVPWAHHGIDTPEQYQAFVEHVQKEA